MNFDLQSFAEDALKNQTSNQLRKGIRSLKKKIEKHWAKIENPAKYYDDWNSYDNEHREGLIWHWQHEIRNFTRCIDDRIDELKNRGEKP